MQHQAPIHIHATHRVAFVRDCFSPQSDHLVSLIEPLGEGRPAKLLIFADEGFEARHSDLAQRITTWAGAHSDRVELAGALHVLPGGEQAKNDPSVFERVLGAIARAPLCRRSYVMAIGGGAVLDVVGFGASIAHRGVRMLRLPTTTLSQADSGVGVKNGINAYGQKNFLGTFAVPWGVVCDPTLLNTLGDRDWLAGFSEAVKVALIKDASLFEQIEQSAPAIVGRDMQAALPIIERSAELHAEHITAGGDAFELGAQRPLDFGHWAAHRLEIITHFSLRHGEAVAVGVALDTAYAAAAGLLDRRVANRVIRCLQALGLPVWHEALEALDELTPGLEQFREHLGGRLTIPLIRGVGQMVEAHEIDPDALAEAVQILSIHR